MTDKRICGYPERGVLCRSTEMLVLPDGTEAERCAAHYGMELPAGPFAAQRPTYEVGRAARDGMIETVAASIERLFERGIITPAEQLGHVPVTPGAVARRVAAVVVDDLAADALARAMAGMAMGMAGS